MTAAAATGYAYVLPAGWLHLDVDPGRRAASVRRAVALRVRREPRLAPFLAQLDRALVHECAVAAAQGAERVSLLAEPVEGALVTASVTFVVAPVPAADHPVDVVRRTWDGPAAAGSASLLSRQWQLLVPWPGRSRLGLLTMASPCRPLWPLLEQTFDGCAQTFHWTWPTAGEAAPH